MFIHIPRCLTNVKGCQPQGLPACELNLRRLAAAGAVAETVTVTSAAGDATLNATDASVGNVISCRQLGELPIQLRGSPAALIGFRQKCINIMPGATTLNIVPRQAKSIAESPTLDSHVYK